MDKQKFIGLCEKWDKSLAGFSGIIRAALELKIDVAVEASVSYPTVNRWANQTSRPHPMVQGHIVSVLASRAKELQ